MELPTSLEKECELLYRYINATKDNNDRLLQCETPQERLQLIHQAYQEMKLVSQIVENQTTQSTLSTNQEKCLQ